MYLIWVQNIVTDRRMFEDHNRNRAPGSIGAGSDPSRVFKGMRMAGQTGSAKVKALNLKVIKIMTEDNLLLVKGSVPGHNNSYIIVQK